MSGNPDLERGARWAFGRTVIGPILAQMLWQLQTSLHASASGPSRVVFFCARGGLVLRRALELFARSVALDLRFHSEDFMVSRLAAFRTAFERDPIAVAPLIDLEFSGRTCGEAVRALVNVSVDADPRWQAPFSMVRLLELMAATALGRRIRAASDTQAHLLRRHIGALRRGGGSIMLCDTGVFGSIVRYLQVGVPEVDWRMTLLFRANYKGIAASHFAATVGVMSESNAYARWQPATAALLYWPLIESILEPSLPSVRYYREEVSGRVVSDLEVVGWRARLEPSAGSMLDGACHYLRGLTAASIPMIEFCGAQAWRRLRRRIVFPTGPDVRLLAVGRRTLDFGSDESAEFSGRPDGARRSLRDRFMVAHQSMWPEGELRKQFPRTAGVLLLCSELSRLIAAMNRARLAGKPSGPAATVDNSRSL